MSRYSAKIPSDNLILAWGYDQPMSEYFFQAFKMEVEDDEDDCVFSISSYSTLTRHPNYPTRTMWSNSEIVEVMKQYLDKAPELQKAIDAISLDISF